MSETNQKINYAFFGTDEFAVTVLEELKYANLLPSLIVTAPDRKQGRGLKLTPSPVKEWASENNLEVLSPEKLDKEFISGLKEKEWDLFVVTSYGKIVRNNILEIPKKGVLNVHPSLLPIYRGPSPIESAMLDDVSETGVTIMLLDEEVDHGPILSQQPIDFDTWKTKPEVREILATVGGQLLSETIPRWINDKIEEQEQEHSIATHTNKISKEDGELKLDDILNNKNSRENYLKFLAFEPWPGIYFFGEDNKRVKIKKASYSYENDTFLLEEVIPEGKNSISWEEYSRNFIQK